jgi:hypothetical protein
VAKAALTYRMANKREDTQGFLTVGADKHPATITAKTANRGSIFYHVSFLNV